MIALPCAPAPFVRKGMNMRIWTTVRLSFVLAMTLSLGAILTSAVEAQYIYGGKHHRVKYRHRHRHNHVGPTVIRYSPSTGTYYRTPIAPVVQSVWPVYVEQPPVVVTPQPVVIPATTVVTPSYSFYQPRQVHVAPVPGAVQQTTTFYRTDVYRSRVYSSTQTYVTPNIRTPSYYTPRFYRY